MLFMLWFIDVKIYKSFTCDKVDDFIYNPISKLENLLLPELRSLEICWTPWLSPLPLKWKWVGQELRLKREIPSCHDGTGELLKECWTFWYLKCRLLYWGVKTYDTLTPTYLTHTGEKIRIGKVKLKMHAKSES